MQHEQHSRQHALIWPATEGLSSTSGRECLSAEDAAATRIFGLFRISDLH